MATPSKSAPLSPSQKKLLIELISEMPVLQDKSHGVAVTLNKAKAWRGIAATFKQNFPADPKSEKQLKRAWEYTKMRTKRERGKPRGRPPPAPVDPLSAAILPLTEDELEPLQQECDSDQGFHDHVVVNAGIEGEERLTSPRDCCQSDSGIIASKRDREAASKEEMSFMNPSLPEKGAVTNMEDDAARAVTEDGKDNEEDNMVTQKKQKCNSGKDPLSLLKNCSKQGSGGDAKKPSQEPMKPPERAYYIVRKHSLDGDKKEEKSVDPTDLFFQSVTATVKTFNPYYLNLCKSKIFSVVSELEMKQILDQGSPAASTIPTPEYTTVTSTLQDGHAMHISPSSDSLHSEETIEFKYHYEDI